MEAKIKLIDEAFLATLVEELPMRDLEACLTQMIEAMTDAADNVVTSVLNRAWTSAANHCHEIQIMAASMHIKAVSDLAHTCSILVKKQNKQPFVDQFASLFKMLNLVQASCQEILDDLAHDV